MADQSWLLNTTGKASAGTLDGDEEIRVVDDPTGTPASKKTTPAGIRTYLLGLANTWNAAQTIASGTLTASAPALNVTQTWNNSGVAFVGSDWNITDTASDAASVLARWRVGGTTKFSIDKSGNALASGYLKAGTDSGKGIITYSANTLSFNATGANTLVLGTSGLTVGAWTGTSIAVKGPSAGGGNLNRAATNLDLESGTCTGNGTGGSLVFKTSTPGASGTSENSATEKGRVDGKGNFVLGTAAISTSATDGFTYVPSSAGAPSGTPTAYTGMVPIEIDTTNSRLYAYVGGAWKSVTLT